MGNNVITIEATKSQRKILRVAAYCRVSSNSDEQLHSYAAQVQYYTRTINENEMMELVDIYADEGLTGTKTEKRDEFNRLVSDCKKGKIDRVLTKSLSRFARNTADALMYARILRSCGVSILFEKENIDTAYMSSELLLALSGAQAQEESISISKNMRWSIQNRMKNGTYVVSSTPYGYVSENKQFRIVPEEAEVIKLIFDSFLSGMGKKAIADMLEKRKVPKGSKITQWKPNTIDYILKNERYIGDALFQKFYTTDDLPFRHTENHGVKTQYYVENLNMPIISKEDFNAVQELLQRNKKDSKSEKSDYPLNDKIICNCGHTYRPVKSNGKRYWECWLHNYDSSKCDSIRIPENEIYEAFITIVNKLRNIRKEVVSTSILQIERLHQSFGGISNRIKEIDKEIATLNNKNLVIARLNNKGIMRPSEYAEQSGRLNSKVNELRVERRKLLTDQDEDNVLSGLRKLDELIEGQDAPLTDFDEPLFKAIVQSITIPSNAEICFNLIGNLKLTEQRR